MSNDTATNAGPATPPVTDWASDYDIFDPQYVADPFPIWDELRETCPMAHTERWGGSWLPPPRHSPRSRPLPGSSSRSPSIRCAATFRAATSIAWARAASATC